MRHVILLGLAALLFCGCSSTYYHVYVDSYAQPDEVRQSTSVVYVEAYPEADNPLLEAQVASKVRYLLGKRGYTITDDIQKADLVVNFVYGIGEPRAEATSSLIYVPGQTVTATTTDNEGYRGTTTARSSGSLRAVPSSRVVNDRYLVVQAIDIDRFAANPEGNDSIVWHATTLSSGSSGDLRKVLNYMLVPTFDFFGRNSNEQVFVKLGDKDRDVRDLMRAGSR